ncbi:DoxX family protein [Actibacterium sp.]|uniref:DoxX family protein n=1 Tax=Actibacterium sp. TaxID=1872125 RepID=UPI00356AE34A
MLDLKTAPYAALVLRLATGIAFLAHGLLKLIVFTPAGTAGFFQSIGLPGALAYLVIAAELAGAVALIAGVYTRWVALGLIPVLLGAVFTVHASVGWLFSNQGGGWEYPVFWIAALMALALLGDGALALGAKLKRA